MEGDLTLSSTEKGLAMKLSDNLLFSAGKVEPSSSGRLFLKKVADLLLRTSHPILIEGHTDNLQINTKEYPSNWELSTARAVNVLRFFQEEGGLPASRLSAIGYGEFKPALPNDTPENRAMNRRVEIILTKP
jgi:chemotaxis protein MotB